jgi:hypothetical protein
LPLYAFEVLLEQTEIDANQIVIVDLRCVSANPRQQSSNQSQPASGRGWSRGTRVVDEHDAVSHEYIILEPDAFADEGVRRSAAVTDNRTFWISTNVPMISVNAPIGPEQVYEIL